MTARRRTPAPPVEADDPIDFDSALPPDFEQAELPEGAGLFRWFPDAGGEQ